MKDRFGRKINYLRISVTDRCNLRCRYCMPAEGVQLIDHSDIMSFEQMTEVAGQAVALGINKVRLTGGEPLVRRGVLDLVSKLAKIEGITDLAMTTNATLLEENAKMLVEAGLMRVNISLDTTDPQRHAHITRGGEITKVINGIQAAKRAGLSPIKLNCVIQESSKEPDAQKVARYAQDNGLQVRFIRVMDFASGTFSQVEGGEGGDCRRCSRLRLSANGLIRPCLFSDLGFSVGKLGAKNALLMAIENKPEQGGPCSENWIRAVGG